MPLMKNVFSLHSMKLRVIHGRNLNILFIIYNFKCDRFLHFMTSYTIVHYVISMMTLHNVYFRQN